jgi:ABC-type nitrate/sulfonate/bicarbonate transport system substrate-binding protein
MSVVSGTTDVRLIVFPGGFNWPVWAAEHLGAFAREGLSVKTAKTPGSVFQWCSLASGDADIAITLMDNVIAYREGQGAPDVVVPDAVALMGLDTRSMPTLMVRPDVASYRGLHGATLAVDAMLTGNALVLRGMLEHGGLTSADYKLEQAGGVTQRFEAVARGGYAGSLFNAPLDAQLKALGFKALDAATSLLDHFQGHVLAARKAWADAHRAQVVGFQRAVLDGLAWLYDRANRDEAFAIYERNMPGAARGAAATAYQVLFDPVSGFPRDGALDVEGIAQVLALRGRYGEPQKRLQPPSAYYDASFLAEAIATAR